MKKNLSKHNSYAKAMGRVKAAIAAGFFLEAITIEESILADRLLRVCREHGYTWKLDKSTLGNQVRFMRRKVLGQLDSLGFLYLDDLEAFWEARNTCLHEIAKSDPGEPTREFDEVIELAKHTAIAGRKLMEEVGNWAARYKTTVVNARRHGQSSVTVPPTT